MKDTELCLHFLDFITGEKNILNSFRQLTSTELVFFKFVIFASQCLHIAGTDLALHPERALSSAWSTSSKSNPEQNW